MADSNYNVIQPVSGLGNIKGIAAKKRRQKRKRRQSSPEHDYGEREPTEDKLSKPIKEDVDKTAAKENDNGHSIDFCA